MDKAKQDWDAFKPMADGWLSKPSPMDIVYIRKLRGFTQEQAATSMGISAPTLRSFEKGAREIHPADWRIFLEKVGVL